MIILNLLICPAFGNVLDAFERRNAIAGLKPDPGLRIDGKVFNREGAEGLFYSSLPSPFHIAINAVFKCFELNENRLGKRHSGLAVPAMTPVSPANEH